MWYKRSSNLVIIHESDTDNGVVYNRLLNCPLFVDTKGISFIETHDELVMDDNDQEFKQMLLDNYVYLPFDKSEIDYIARGIENHMESLKDGEFTSLLDLRVSSVCNFGCKHCIASKAQSNEFIRFEEAKSIIDAYYSFLNKKKNSDEIVLDIHFGIAEPLIAFDEIHLIVDYLSTTYKGIKKNLSINTNLSLLTREQAEFFRDNNIHVHVSIDGIGDTNDLIRTYKDGSGTYSDILEKINLMKEVGYPIFDIGVTLTDKNYQRFRTESNEFINWCKEYGITEIACEFDLINSVTIPTEEKVDFLLSFVDRMAENGISFDGTWSIPYMNLINATYAESAFGFCRGASGINLSVDKKGYIYICSCSSMPICSIYSLEEEINPGGKFYTFVQRNLINNIPECEGCVLEGCCLGQCRVTHEYHDTFDEKLIEQCSFYKLMTHKLLLREISTYDFD